MDQIIARLSRLNVAVWALLSLVIIFHLFLIYKTFIIDTEGNMRAAVAGYGDIPFHMTQVSKFAFSKTINFNEPIFDGERMRYAFFINLVSGLLLRLSGNWLLAMQIPAMGFMAGGTILMFLIYRNFLKSHVLALVAVIIFLFGSGLGANVFLKHNFVESGFSLGNFTQYLVERSASTITKWDAKFPDQNIGWGAPLSLVFLHQRSFILGFFMFTLFFYFFEKWQRDQTNIKLAVTCAIIVGISPLAHYHSFVAMSTVLGVFGLLATFQRKKVLILRLAVMGFVILVFALPQIIYLIQGKNAVFFTHDSFIKFRLGWMAEPTTGSVLYDPGNSLSFTSRVFAYLNFLRINFGVMLPVFAMSLIVMTRLKSVRENFRSIIYWAISGVSLFVLVQVMRFQPWDYDDNKILVYFQFFAAPVIIALIWWFLKRVKLLGCLIIALFLIFSTYSGFIDEIPRLLVPFDKLPVIFDKHSQKVADFMKKDIASNERVITSSTHLNLVSSLAGKPVVVGYPGWLWTRGISYGDRENDLQNFFADPLKYKYVAKKYGARYVLVDPSVVYDWHADIGVFDKQFSLLYSSGEYSLYQIN